MADLLDQLGKKKVEEGGKSPNSSVSDIPAGTSLTDDQNIVAGDDLADKVNTKPEEEKAATPTEEPKKEEVNTKFKDPETWTKESALLEVKKTREEAKTYRLQLKEQEARFNDQFEKLKSEMNEKLQTASEAQKELEARKAAEEDKKRTMEEKLANREARLTEYEAKINSIQDEYENKLKDLQSRVLDFETEREAQLKVYKERINEELENVPESKRKFAEMIVKGYDDPRDAWAALSEAKLGRLFEEKEVVVSHATPGTDASRMTQDKLDAAAAEAKSKLKSSDKMKLALGEIKKSGGLRGRII